jgi:hypothetical protein
VAKRIVTGMVVVGQPIRFDDDDPRPMLRHLDAWSRQSLVSPEAWASTVERCDQWLDYSARNQVLLASYGVAGPVAGAATWERVASTETGRGCAVRAGEHGLLVRAPVVELADVPSDKSRVAARSDSVVGSLRWEPVFALEQLARRPVAGALASPVVPPMSTNEWSETVRVATGRMLGRTPRRIDDPIEQLSVLAGKVAHGAGRTRLDPEHRLQVARLVTARVGMTPEPTTAFDPSALPSRDRWRLLVDVRHASSVVLAAVSHAVGVDLAASPLPRHAATVDREVSPGRRNYLAPADVRGLPLGVWVEAGPYTRAEWLARGVAGGVGRAAFMRVNDRSYLAAYETRGGSMWRLETVGRGAHHGLVAEGTSDTLTAAKDSARDALRDRFPDVARAVDSSVGGGVVSPAFGWVRLPGGRDERTEHRVFDERVAAMVSPGPGGQWQTWVTVDGNNRQGPHSRNAAVARDVADGLAHGALMELAAVAPDRANAMVRDLAGGDGTWNRDQLVSIVGHRLTDADRVSLAETKDMRTLTRHLLDVGVLAPATILGVLHAEVASIDAVTAVVPSLGMPTSDAIRVLHRDWGVERMDAGAALGATAGELRAAGCSAIEMLAAAPREELRRLDAREETWIAVAPSLIEAGYSIAQAVEHMAAHAPTPEAFAAGVTAIVESPLEAFAFAARRAGGEDLAVLSERYELSPVEAAKTMAIACVPVHNAAEAVLIRCEGDLDVTTDVCERYLGLAAGQTRALLVDGPTSAIVPIGLAANYDLDRPTAVSASVGVSLDD